MTDVVVRKGGVTLYAILPFLLSLLIVWMPFGAIAIVSPLIFAGIYFYYFRKKPKLASPTMKDIGFVVLGIMGIYVYLFVSAAIFPVGEGQETMAMMQEIPFGLQFMGAVVLAPICEELFFRDGLYKLIPNKKTYLWLSALIFAFYHVQITLNWYDDLRVFLFAFTSGLIFAILYKRRESIVLSYMAHTFINLVSILLSQML